MSDPDFERRIDWGTPQPLWLGLHQEFRFTLDVAASADNTKLPVFFDGTPGRDGLLRSWVGHRAWCNPPYNPKGEIERWLEKALQEAAQGVFSALLIPMASSRGYFNNLIVPYAQWWTFNGRIAFNDPLAKERSSPKQDNLLVVLDPLSEVLGHMGVRDRASGAVVWRDPHKPLTTSASV